MPKTPCKAPRKDGKPCQGNGLPEHDGYCIAHVSPAVAGEWRSRGGKASSNAARADKRIPERLRGTIDKLSQAMDDVIAGKMEPSTLSALARAARVLLQYYRLADEEMDLIRAEESATAAAQVAGVAGDPAILDAAAAITDWQKDYTLESLIAQGLVTLEPDPAQETGEPPVHVLTAAGRQRFGYQRLSAYTQQDIETWKEVAAEPDLEGAQLPAVLLDLHKLRTTLEEFLTDFSPGAEPVLDPLTGQVLTQLPTIVQPATVPVAAPGEAEQAAKEMQKLLRRARAATREAEKLYEKRYGHPFDYRDELGENEED